MTIYPLPPVPEGFDPQDWEVAVSAIRDYCGWHIAPSVTETLTVDGPGRGGQLLLPTLRLTAVAAVQNDGTAVELDNVQWTQRGALRGARWNDKYRGVTATVTHGYDEWPPALLAVARSMAAQGAGSNATRITSGPHSVELTEEARAGAWQPSPAAERVLVRYRIGGRP